MRQSTFYRNFIAAVAFFGIFPIMQDNATAQARQGAHANVNRQTAGNRNTNVNRQATANRNVNVNQRAQVNQNVNVNRNINVDVDNHNDYHPFATAAAVTAGVAVTSAVIGSIAHSLPPSCQTIVANGVTYQQCGSTWYQPQYAGTQVNYVVVSPP